MIFCGGGQKNALKVSHIIKIAPYRFLAAENISLMTIISGKEMTERYQLACANGDLLKIRRSLTTYDSIDFVNNSGQTGLMIAVDKNREQTVLELLKSGANVNAKDSNNWTALHFAAKNGSYVITEILLKKKANIYARCQFHQQIGANCSAASLTFGLGFDCMLYVAAALRTVFSEMSLNVVAIKCQKICAKAALLWCQ